MKRILSLILAVLTLVSLFGCASDNSGKSKANENVGQVETIDMTTEKGSIQYVGIEMANPLLVKDENAMLVKFTFTNFQERPSKVSTAFKIKFYQNGVEVSTFNAIYGDGGDHYTLAGMQWKEVMQNGTSTFAVPVPKNGDEPLTIGVENIDDTDNYQLMEVDLTTALTAQPVDSTVSTVSDESSTTVAGGNINMDVAKGAIRYVGIERANKGLCDSNDVVVVSFDFTNYQDIPSQCQNVFHIKFYQNGVQIDVASWTSSKGGAHYKQCSNYFNEALKDGTVSFGRPVVISGDSPLTIIVEENDNHSNYQMMEVEIPA